MSNEAAGADSTSDGQPGTASHPYATGGGGVAFAHRVAAVYLTSILTGNRRTELASPATSISFQTAPAHAVEASGEPATSISFQTAPAHAVDDLLVTADARSGPVEVAIACRAVRRSPRRRTAEAGRRTGPRGATAGLHTRTADSAVLARRNRGGSARRGGPGRSGEATAGTRGPGVLSGWCRGPAVPLAHRATSRAVAGPLPCRSSGIGKRSRRCASPRLPRRTRSARRPACTPTWRWRFCVVARPRRQRPRRNAPWRWRSVTAQCGSGDVCAPS